MRHMDIEIAEKIMGWEQREDIGDIWVCENVSMYVLDNWSTNPKDALAVVKRMRHLGYQFQMSWAGGVWCCVFTKIPQGVSGYGWMASPTWAEEETFELAICRAALMASELAGWTGK